MKSLKTFKQAVRAKAGGLRIMITYRIAKNFSNSFYIQTFQNNFDTPIIKRTKRLHWHSYVCLLQLPLTNRFSPSHSRAHDVHPFAGASFLTWHGNDYEDSEALRNVVVNHLRAYTLEDIITGHPDQVLLVHNLLHAHAELVPATFAVLSTPITG